MSYKHLRTRLEDLVSEGRGRKNIADKSSRHGQPKDLINEGIKQRTFINICLIYFAVFQCRRNFGADCLEERLVVDDVGQGPEGDFVDVAQDAE